MSFNKEAFLKTYRRDRKRLGNSWVYRKLIQRWVIRLGQTQGRDPIALIEQSGLDFERSETLGRVLLLCWALEHGLEL